VQHLNESQHIDYAKSKSYATLRREDPSFVPPSSANASAIATRNGKIAIEKRPRDEEMAGGQPHSKREKGDDDEEEEMEIDEDEDSAQHNTANETPGRSHYLRGNV
jgi:hypothetical protein